MSKANQVQRTTGFLTEPNIQNITTSFLSSSSLFVAVHLILQSSHSDTSCTITLSVYSFTKSLVQHRLNCSTPWTTINELPIERSYQVCASIGNKYPKDDEETMICTSIDSPKSDWFAGLLNAKSYAFLLSATFTAILFLCMLLVYRTVAKACKRPINSNILQTHQCFLPVPPIENGSQRPRYVKLQATTVL